MSTTWTFGPNNVYTASWDGNATLTVTLTASGAPVTNWEPQTTADVAVWSAAAASTRLAATPAAEPAGTLAVRYPSSAIATSALATFTTGGQVAVGSIGLTRGMVIANISILFGSTGVTGPTHLWFALLDSSLRVLAVSADQTSGAQPANTFKTLPVTTDGSAPYTVPATGAYYIAVSSSASTTAPTAAGITPAGSVTGITPVVCGTAGTQAAPPAAGAQLASGTVTFSTAMNFAAWVS